MRIIIFPSQLLLSPFEQVFKVFFLFNFFNLLLCKLLCRDFGFHLRHSKSKFIFFILYCLFFLFIFKFFGFNYMMRWMIIAWRLWNISWTLSIIFLYSLLNRYIKIINAFLVHKKWMPICIDRLFKRILTIKTYQTLMMIRITLKYCIFSFDIRIASITKKRIM